MGWRVVWVREEKGWLGWNISVTMGAQLGARYLCQFAFVSHELPLHTQFHSLTRFIYELYRLPCNLVLGCRVFQTDVLTYILK